MRHVNCKCQGHIIAKSYIYQSRARFYQNDSLCTMTSCYASASLYEGLPQQPDSGALARPSMSTYLTYLSLATRLCRDFLIFQWRQVAFAPLSSFICRRLGAPPTRLRAVDCCRTTTQLLKLSDVCRRPATDGDPFDCCRLAVRLYEYQPQIRISAAYGEGLTSRRVCFFLPFPYRTRQYGTQSECMYAYPAMFEQPILRKLGVISVNFDRCLAYLLSLRVKSLEL